MVVVKLPDASTVNYIGVYHKNEWIDTRALPFCYTVVSAYFLKRGYQESGTGDVVPTGVIPGVCELHLSPEEDLELEGEYQ